MATKKKVEKKSAAKPKTNEPSVKETAQTTAPETTAPETEAPETEAPAKPKRIVDEFKRITTKAVIPGVGEIPVTLIEVDHKGKKYRARTRREAQLWLRAQRKQDAKKLREEKELQKMQREMERAEKVAGYVSDRLVSISNKLTALASGKTVTDEQREKVAQAVALLSEVAIERQKAEADNSEESETDEE